MKEYLVFKNIFGELINILSRRLLCNGFFRAIQINKAFIETIKNQIGKVLYLDKARIFYGYVYKLYDQEIRYMELKTDSTTKFITPGDWLVLDSGEKVHIYKSVYLEDESKG